MAPHPVAPNPRRIVAILGLLGTLAVATLALASYPGDGERGTCRTNCWKASRACMDQARYTRGVLLAGCSGGAYEKRQCRRIARATFRGLQHRCRRFKAGCKACCRAGGRWCDARCGDGVVTRGSGEECDGSSWTDGRDGDANCRCTGDGTSSCGGSVVSPEAGEECDPPGSACAAGGTCSAKCECIPSDGGGSCGDGTVDRDAGEQCDPPGSACADDGTCSAQCQCVT